jgi:hypothetical protein
LPDPAQSGPTRPGERRQWPTLPPSDRLAAAAAGWPAGRDPTGPPDRGRAGPATPAGPGLGWRMIGDYPVAG